MDFSQPTPKTGIARIAASPPPPLFLPGPFPITSRRDFTAAYCRNGRHRDTPHRRGDLASVDTDNVAVSAAGGDGTEEGRQWAGGAGAGGDGREEGGGGAASEPCSGLCRRCRPTCEAFVRAC